MYVQLNSVIIDPDTTNRNELAGFLGQFGINPIAQLASSDQILAVPTLVRRLPPPVKKIIGNLADADRVLLGLGLRQGGA